jgi:hypothetical protein
MKLSWALFALSAVVCTTACMVLFGQHALWTKQSGFDEEQRLKYETFEATFQEKLFIKNTLQNQLHQQRKNLKEMEGERGKADLEQHQKAAELDDCKAIKVRSTSTLKNNRKSGKITSNVYSSYCLSRMLFSFHVRK